MYRFQALDEIAIDDHLERYLGPCETVMSSIPAVGGAHVYICPATPEREFVTLVTMGLSGFAMPVPEGVEDRASLQHAELFTYLPRDWKTPGVSGIGDARDWPVEMLRRLVGYAWNQQVWLGLLHTIPNLLSNPPGAPFIKGSKLTHVILLAPVQEKPGFDRLVIRKTRVRFLHALPITQTEHALKVARGFHDSLAPLLDSGRIPTMIDEKRASAVRQERGKGSRFGA